MWTLGELVLVLADISASKKGFNCLLWDGLVYFIRLHPLSLFHSVNHTLDAVWAFRLSIYQLICPIIWNSNNLSSMWGD